jgi:hypothetical protein
MLSVIPRILNWRVAVAVLDMRKEYALRIPLQDLFYALRILFFGV